MFECVIVNLVLCVLLPTSQHQLLQYLVLFASPIFTYHVRNDSRAQFYFQLIMLTVNAKFKFKLTYLAGNDCRECTLSCRPLNGILDSFQSLQLKPPQCKVTSAMSSLQGYYGLTPPRKNMVAEGTEMAVYKSGRAHYLEDQLVPRNSSLSAPLPGRHRKSRSLVNVNGYFPQNGEINNVKAAGEASDNSDADRSIRRRQKADVFQSMRTPELLMKEDSNGGFSGRTGKNLALRAKSGFRVDGDVARINAMPSGGDPSLADGLSAAVRKSSSTSNLQESENNSSIWPSSMWSLKPDAITRPIFDGLPKPTTSRRNKAALD